MRRHHKRFADASEELLIRVILSYHKSRTIDCVFAEHRSIVYEVFADAMIERLMRDR